MANIDPVNWNPGRYCCRVLEVERGDEDLDDMARVSISTPHKLVANQVRYIPLQRFGTNEVDPGMTFVLEVVGRDIDCLRYGIRDLRKPRRTYCA